MMHVGEHTVDLDPHCAPVAARVKPASAQAVAHVLAQSDRSEDGRSEWVWVRLQNGDLVLGVYPQGDTYLAHEGEHVF